MRKKFDLENTIFTTCNTLFLTLLMVVTVYPFLNTLAISFNEAFDTVKGGIYLWPRKITLQNYNVVLSNSYIYDAAWISISKTILMVITNLFFTTMLAYTISRKEYVLKSFVTIVFVLTMYFNAGLIPNYVLIKSLGMVGSYWVYIIPNLISAFNLVVIRTYISTGIPESLVESARIDGAGEFRTFIQIIFPLCKPVLATIALFVAVGSWNAWFDTFLYNSGQQRLSTLQYELVKLLSSAMQQSSGSSGQGISSSAQAPAITPMSLRAAITIVTAVPILIVYPFAQKHFVTGLTIGGVKE